ncbi:ATP-binding cassette domain-containing protein [Vallitalea pronyensis]|uniref:ATP-binding cassette domain-containing protein n=2 Tax=Vallitalea pronyensis TaxID=1348613 RepID=A0A8J8SJN8_9FIRM|nr:ATP-binding cassette domain-containing protein [Vallitalea pronyensis]
MIEISNLCKSFNEVEVLKGIDLKVEKGSIFALLGSNGAGKTTMIKILSTLLKPDGGTVKLAGIDVAKKPSEVKKHIALTGQYAAVDEILTGRENLDMIGKLLDIDNRKEKVEMLLMKFKLLEDANRRVSTYSGGMKRKIDIAMSLIGRPSVIFLDEPTTGLDPMSRKSMWKMIKELSETGITIFLTTQYLDEAEYLADKIAIVNGGVIIAEGTNDELKDIIASNIIKLSFGSEEDTYKAQLILKDYHPVMDVNSCELKIETHESMVQVFEVFDVLKNHHIKIKNFEKKKASLEEVFLKVISEDSEREACNAIGD